MKKILFLSSVIALLAFTTINEVGNYKKESSNFQDTILPKKDTIVTLDSMLNKNDSTSKILLDSTVKPKYYYGIASFYSKNLEGTPTSTQEVFKHNKFTCASNRFKLNTWLKVTNINNGKSVVVRVNDRMHPRMDKKGRIVDLSLIAARNLDFIAKGLTKVKVEVVQKPSNK